MPSRPCDRRGCPGDCPLCGVHIYRGRTHMCAVRPPRPMTPDQIAAALADCRAALASATTTPPVQEAIRLA